MPVQLDAVLPQLPLMHALLLDVVPVVVPVDQLLLIRAAQAVALDAVLLLDVMHVDLLVVAPDVVHVAPLVVAPDVVHVDLLVVALDVAHADLLVVASDVAHVDLLDAALDVAHVDLLDAALDVEPVADVERADLPLNSPPNQWESTTQLISTTQ